MVSIFVNMAKYLRRLSFRLIVFLGIIGIFFCLWLLSDNTERQTVTVGFFEYPPYSMLDAKTGRPTGYHVDILEKIAKSQNLEIKYVNTFPVNYPDNIPKGKPYIMGLPVTITPQKQKIYNFSWPCDENDSILVMKKGSSLKNVSGLKRCVIGVIEKRGKHYCREMHKKGRIKNYKEFFSTVELYKALAADKVDAIIVGRNIALYFQGLHPGVFKFSGSVFNHCEYEGFPIQKKQEWLLKRVNDGLRRIMNNGEYSRIYRKYFLSEGERICN